MDALAMDLKQMGLNNGGGAFRTRVERTRGFLLIARELRALNHELPSARSIKDKHIQKLVAKWQADGLATGTIKNRVSWMRTWAGNVRKGSTIPKSNADLGIALRSTFNGNKAGLTPKAQIAKLDERMQLAVKLQMYFGMRVEESIMFRPKQAIKGDAIHMQASWCKGGRARVIPIFHPNQQALLDEVRTLVGDGCLIPKGADKHIFRDQLDRKTWAAGIRDKHKHRHWYSQRRYELMTGQKCTAAGGKPYEQMSKAERKADAIARKIISRELGHERLEITNCYLGYRFACRKGAA